MLIADGTAPCTLPPSPFAIAVIGGGASGLCAAISAARTLKESGADGSVVLFEALPRVGKKLLSTGNGRCNLSNTSIKKEHYHGGGDFAMRVIGNAGEDAVREFFRGLGLYMKIDPSGRVYPLSAQASAVLDALRLEAENVGVETLTSNKVTSLKKEDGAFLINENLKARRVILAAGGKSGAACGCDGSGFELLKGLGVRVLPLFPALTALLLEDYPKSLKGVRAECRARIISDGKVLAEDCGEVQFNEKGVSGIPIMQISRHASEILYTGEGGEIYLKIDALPALREDEIKEYIRERKNANPALAAGHLLTGLMPKAIARVCLNRAGIPLNAPIADIKEAESSKLAEAVKSMTYRILGAAGFEASQVTAGGADTGCFSPETLECLDVPGLYCCGEILNVDGICGGYNLHWAWCGGIVAGRAAAGKGR